MIGAMNLARWVAKNAGLVVATTVLALLGVFALIGLGLHQAVRHEPAFYERALAVTPERLAVAGDEMERHVLELHNDLRKPGEWRAVFSDEQINGWLASDLEEKFPNLLPDGVTEPRVSIEPDIVHVACRYESAQVNAVISLTLDIHLTDHVNEIAVRVRKARAGALPLPLKGFLDRIAKVAASNGLPLEWKQEDGDPVALFRIPAEHQDYITQDIRLEMVELRDGEAHLSGSSGKHPTDQVARSPDGNETSQH